MKLRTLEKTCEACPAQWEGQLEDGRYVYVRYRWGVLRVGMGDTKDQAIGDRGSCTDFHDRFHGTMDTEAMLGHTGLTF